MDNLDVKTITKHFQRIRDAERFQEQLYDLYDSVQLIHSPMFDEERGAYIWRVKGEVK
jgi:hypothetical protein